MTTRDSYLPRRAGGDTNTVATTLIDRRRFMKVGTAAIGGALTGAMLG